MQHVRDWIAALGCVVLLTGCSTTHHLQVKEPERAGTRQPVSFGSFGKDETISRTDCRYAGAADVYVEQNFFRSLLGTLTLGAYQQTRLEYVCAKEPDPLDFEDEAPEELVRAKTGAVTIPSFLGLAAKRQVADCAFAGMEEVRVKNSFFRSLLSTVTLGAVQTTRIEYDCVGFDLGGADGTGDAS